MSHVLEGVTRVLYLTATSVGAGDTACNMRPAQGCVWEVLTAVACQSDGAVSQTWVFTDPDTAAGTIGGHTAGAAWEKFPLGCWGPAAGPNHFIGGPVVLTYDRYLSFHFTASAAAKSSYVYALVREYRGVAVEA